LFTNENEASFTLSPLKQSSYRHKQLTIWYLHNALTICIVKSDGLEYQHIADNWPINR